MIFSGSVRKAKTVAGGAAIWVSRRTTSGSFIGVSWAERVPLRRWRAQWLLDVAISRSAYRCLHRLRRGDELIERLAPAVAEAHAIVRIAILLVLVHGEG